MSRTRIKLAAGALTVLLCGGVAGLPDPASAAPTAPATSVVGLQYGARGDNVVALQQALNRVGIGVKYGVDGYFGSATRASVKAFQRYKGLAVTGVVDAATARALGFTAATAPAATAPSPVARATTTRTARATATPATAGAVVNGLQPGASGAAVADLQRALTRFGWPLRTDGSYGARTQAAVAAVQRANGLAATGSVDARTSSLLRLGTAAAPAAAPTPAAAPVANPAPAPAAPSGAPSNRAAAAVAAAQSQLGVAYVAFQQSPGTGFDCSGLTAWAWAQAGVNLPHQSGLQYASLPKVAKEQARAGDLLFYKTPISHVTIYIGNGRMIHAPRSGSVVQVATVNWANVVGVARPG